MKQTVQEARMAQRHLEALHTGSLQGRYCQGNNLRIRFRRAVPYQLRSCLEEF
ncbi:hypothetical protein D3C73_1663690 [compost metagenome]